MVRVTFELTTEAAPKKDLDAERQADEDDHEDTFDEEDDAV